MNEVKFTEANFKELRKFQNRMNVVFGETAYVGTDYATVVLDYSPKLKAMLRPYPSEVKYDYEVKMLYCDDCKKSALFLATSEENSYLCPDCVVKRLKKRKD